MGKNNFSIGDHNVQCDICGKKRKRSQCKKTWDGFLACLVEKCWYPKHPNDYPRRIVIDGLPVQDARPRPEQAQNSYIVVGGITRWEDVGLFWANPNWLWRDDPWNQDIVIK